MKLFVYGTLMRGFSNHHYLDGAEYLGRARTRGTLLDFGRFPGLIQGDGVVWGELYEITEDMLPDLDRLEGVPYLYERVTMPVCVDWNHEDEDWEDCTTYLYARTRHRGQDVVVESGRWGEQPLI